MGTDDKRTANTIFEALREEIMNFRLKPNQRIVERDLAEKLGTSRTPVREAIHKLEKEGLVIVEPNRGAYVAPLTVEDMTEIYQIRIVTEALAGKLATPHITQETIDKLKVLNAEMKSAAEQGNIKLAHLKNKEFHHEIYKKCNNKRLYELITYYWDYAQRLRLVVLSVTGRIFEVQRDHECIIQALAGKNEEEIERLLKIHLTEAQRVFESALQKDMIIL